MSCLSEGESEENQRPALIASLSSIVRMGSSIRCLEWAGERIPRVRLSFVIAIAGGAVVSCVSGDLTGGGGPQSFV